MSKPGLRGWPSGRRVCIAALLMVGLSAGGCQECDSCPPSFILSAPSASAADGVCGADAVADVAAEPVSSCENGLLDPGEACDHDVPCAEILGPSWVGIATCRDDCTRQDTSGCTEEVGTDTNPACHCSDIAENGVPVDGPYVIQTADGTRLRVWCDFDAEGRAWMLAVSRSYMPIPGPWGTFFEGDGDVSPWSLNSIPFLDLAFVPRGVRLEAVGTGQMIDREVPGDADWQAKGKGLRLRTTEGDYLVLSDQPALDRDTMCFVSAEYSSGYKCDGNDGQLSGQGWFGGFAEDEFCNCDGHGWKLEPEGCEATLCKPTGLFALWLRY